MKCNANRGSKNDRLGNKDQQFNQGDFCDSRRATGLHQTKGHTVVCFSNLEQIGFAFAIYINDRFPNPRDLKIRAETLISRPDLGAQPIEALRGFLPPLIPTSRIPRPKTINTTPQARSMLTLGPAVRIIAEVLYSAP